MKIPSKRIMVGTMLLVASATCLSGCVKDDPKPQQSQQSYLQSHADMYGPAPAPDVHEVIVEPNEPEVDGESGVSD